MVKSEQQKYETSRERIENNEDITSADRKLILEFLDANDPDHHMVQMSGGETKQPSTLGRYATSLNRVAEDLEEGLSEATDYDINSLMDGYFNGTVEGTKDDGLTGGTVRNREGPIRIFYRYHDDLGVDPEEIYFHEKEDTSVDERDLFTPQEIKDIREEAKRRGGRDACLIDLLLYTGQRISALLNLRLKDINEDEGTFYLNEDGGDLKGAKGKRPLLGAQKSVRDLKRQHPTGEPEDYLITVKRDWTEAEYMDKGDRLARNTASELLKRIGRSAGVDKPVHAHNFRHNFVTVCKRDYGMDDATIKHLIGHTPGSKVMETTYQHLTDEDYIQDAEEEFGIREPEQENPLTPPVCNQCGEPLDGDWEACPYCGMNYSPASQQTKEQIQEDIYEDKGDTEPDSRESEAVDDLRELLKENPELVQDLLGQQ